MTERKPPNMGFESWVDKQVREAQERGEFDNLPGHGKPLPGIERPIDPTQWAADWVRREGHSTEALLPPSLQLRKEIHRLPETVRDLRSEPAVRETVAELNTRIKAWILLPDGPQVVLQPVDVDAVVERWRSERQAAAAERVTPGATTDSARAQETVPGPAANTEARTPRRWWRRFTRRRRQQPG